MTLSYNMKITKEKIAEYYQKEQTKLKERGFAAHRRKKIIKILGDTCSCGNKASILHHTTYEGIFQYHDDLEKYCEFLKHLCEKCHPKEKKIEYNKELGISIKDYKRLLLDYQCKMKKDQYSKVKIAITIDNEIKNKIDKIKHFPKWRGNRSELIEEGLREFLSRDIKKEAKCIFCDCTDSHACKGGCYWVIVDRKKGIGVCSQCALKVMGDPEKLKKIKEIV